MMLTIVDDGTRARSLLPGSKNVLDLKYRSLTVTARNEAPCYQCRLPSRAREQAVARSGLPILRRKVARRDGAGRPARTDFEGQHRQRNGRTRRQFFGYDRLGNLVTTTPAHRRGRSRGHDERINALAARPGDRDDRHRFHGSAGSGQRIYRGLTGKAA